jgi:hypothetical protein
MDHGVTNGKGSDNSAGRRVEGGFTFRSLPVRWTVREDSEAGVDGHHWVLQVQLIDVGISRRYPDKISQIEAERESRAIAPMLLLAATEWLK